jgi:acyl dehydratase
MNPEFLLGMPPLMTKRKFTRKDTMLYALGTGACGDADGDELRFVYERDLQALPTYPTVVAYPGFWMREPQYEIDWKRVLHIEQSVELHRTIPVEGSVRSELHIDEILDKGREKGAIVFSSRRIYSDDDGGLIAILRQASMLRGDGGFGGPPRASARPEPVPEREADHLVTLTTRRDQALIYRLSGDDNPLHADPKVAVEAGFSRPILHGLCTFAVAGRAVLKATCANEPSRLRKIGGRFSAPVYPGETIVTEIWTVAPGTAVFRSKVAERDVIVLDNCSAEFKAQDLT